MRLILLCLALTACASHKKTVNIAPDFQPYFDRFEADAKTQGIQLNVDDLIIEWGDLGALSATTTEAGLCQLGDDKTPTITINDSPVTGVNWQTETDGFKEALIYHELGHCILARVHDLTTAPMPEGQSVPQSVMDPMILGSAVYEKFHAHYVGELFSFYPRFGL